MIRGGGGPALSAEILECEIREATVWTFCSFLGPDE